MKIKTVTAQQEQGYKEYLAALNECEYLTISFTDWYWHWCFENGYYNDQNSLIIED